jgi:hypothetical protein
MRKIKIQAAAYLGKGFVATLLTSLIFSAMASPARASQTVDVDFGELVFSNPGYPLEDGFVPTEDDNPDSDDIGEEALVNDAFVYPDVFPGVDAIVTVIEESNLGGDHVDKVDEGQDRWNAIFTPDEFNVDQFSYELIVPDDDPIWVEINPSAGGGSATFRVDFLVADTQTPVTLQNVGISTQDIDDGQFVEFVDPTGYQLSSTPPTDLAVEESQDIVTFTSAVGDASDSEDEDHWAYVYFSSTSSITFTTGNPDTDDAEFRVHFNAVTWDVDPVEVNRDAPAPSQPAPAATTPTLAVTGAQLDGNGYLIGFVALASMILGASILIARRFSKSQ